VTVGLWVFITVLVLDIAGLSLDGVLYLLGLTTITELVRTSQPWIGVLILILQVVGTVGLFDHFYQGI
jgi:hypothetical protein